MLKTKGGGVGQREGVAVWLFDRLFWGLVFAVLYGFGEHNNKKLCPLFMQINERIENFVISPKKSKSNLKIPFVNFGCGLLPIAISILGNLVSDF